MRSYVKSLLRFWSLRRIDSTSLPLYPSVLLLVVWCIAWIIYDWWEARPSPKFFADGIPLFAWYGLAVVLLAALLRWRARPTPPASLVLCLVVGLIPVPMLLATVASTYLPPVWLWVAELLAAAYLLLYLARGMRSLTGHSHRLLALCGVSFVVLFVLASSILDVVPDVWDPLEIERRWPPPTPPWPMKNNCCSVRRGESIRPWRHFRKLPQPSRTDFFSASRGWAMRRYSCRKLDWPRVSWVSAMALANVHCP